MPRLLSRNSDFRQSRSWLLGSPVVAALLLLTYLVLRPDPASSHFYRAQKLQAAGQSDSALRLYSLIVSSLPNSSYAPLALQQQGEILTAMARRSGDALQYREALAAYARLASEYSAHSLAGEALLAAGSLAANDLHDAKTAEGFYQNLMEIYPDNPEYVSEAVLRLGRIALQNGAGVVAQNYFARLLKEYSRFPERCAEAQYQSGVVLETLLKNKAQARIAYEATIKKWPRSVWAASAKERLGMLLYSASRENRPARRVLLQIAALPDARTGDSRLAALKLLLAARGLEVGEATIDGWSLRPFRAGFSPENPGRLLKLEENFEAIVANAGLVYSQQNFDDAGKALSVLRDEMDAGHVPLVALDGWVVVVGYDSSLDEIMTQKPGAQQQTWAAKNFVARWKKESGLSFFSFHAPGENLRPQIPEKPAPIASEAAPDLTAPTRIYKLPALSLTNAHRRALRRAALWMKRPRDGGVLLNIEALRAMVAELESLSKTPDSPVPTPEAVAKNPLSEEGSTPDATPTRESPAPANSALLSHHSARWKNLRYWFGAPLNQWIESRRDAAAYLETAGSDLRDARVQRASEELRSAMTLLQNARAAMPSPNAFEEDADAARAALTTIGDEIKSALEAEKRATAIMAAT